MFPSPPPETGSYRTDPRIARGRSAARVVRCARPRVQGDPPSGRSSRLECIAIMSPTFLSPRFHTTYHVPTYQEWLERQDLRPAYRFHRRFLQQLQWRAPAQRWVLKAPAHLFAFDALLEAYPDARIVQTHRDPLTVLASVASLTRCPPGRVHRRARPPRDRPRGEPALDQRISTGPCGSVAAVGFPPSDSSTCTITRWSVTPWRWCGASTRTLEIPLTEAAEALDAPVPRREPQGQARRPSLLPGLCSGSRRTTLSGGSRPIGSLYGVPREERASPQ